MLRKVLHRQRKPDQTARDFVTLAAHQLKTPIAELKGYVENMLSGAAGTLTDKQALYLKQMQAVCQRTSHLVNNLLDISQIEQGIITMNLTPTDLQQLASDAVHTFEQDIQAKGLAVSVEAPGNSVVVFADPLRTTEVLRNLVHNAIKFTDKGAITVRVDSVAKWGTVTVTDTGVGVSESARKDLFQRTGVLGKPFMSNQGAGLGLYVARQFMTFEKGSVRLLPSDTGASFEVRLPLFTANTPLGKKVQPTVHR